MDAADEAIEVRLVGVVIDACEGVPTPGTAAVDAGDDMLRIMIVSDGVGTVPTNTYSCVTTPAQTAAPPVV